MAGLTAAGLTAASRGRDGDPVIASTRAIAESGRVAAPDGRQAVEQLARWLLATVAADLLLTRVVVRLAIFIPKGDPWATLSAALGRVGAAADVLVTVVGVLLLGALLIRAGRHGGWLDRASLLALAAVAASGLAHVYVAPTQGVVSAIDVLVIAIAAGTAVRGRFGPGVPVVARVGIVALASAVALAALGDAVQVSGILAQSDTGGPAAAGGLMIRTAGEVAFTMSAALVGLGGIVLLRRPVVGSRRSIGVGVVAACVVVLAGTFAPASWGAILIWSLGLTGAIPLPFLALALGLAIAGLPALHRTAPQLAVGAAIVLFAGYGLAASGLLFAALLGLIVSVSIGHPGRVRSAARGIA
jgi:hypothetical protein